MLMSSFKPFLIEIQYFTTVMNTQTLNTLTQKIARTIVKTEVKAIDHSTNEIQVRPL